MQQTWVQQWFNQDYLALYADHNQKEAEQQAQFIIQALELKKNNLVLDIGCGAGRHSYALAKKGMNVTGIDLSSYLISEANEIKLAHPQLQMHFMQKDMRNMGKIGSFDAAISIFTSFGYFTHEENQQILTQIKKQLSIGKKFFLDYLNPNYVRSHLIPEEMRIVNNEEVIIKKTIENNRIKKKIIFPGRYYEESVQLYDYNDLKNMLYQTGFIIANAWNNYNSEIFDDSGERILIKSILKIDL